VTLVSSRGEKAPSAVPWTAIGCVVLALVVIAAVALALAYLASLDWPPVGVN
jgi:hypothetical protein